MPATVRGQCTRNPRRETSPSAADWGVRVKSRVRKYLSPTASPGGDRLVEDDVPDDSLGVAPLPFFRSRVVWGRVWLLYAPSSLSASMAKGEHFSHAEQ